MEFLRSIMLDFYNRDSHISNLRFLFNHCSTIIILKKYILCNSCVIEKKHSYSDINELFKLFISKQTQCSRLKLSVLFVMRCDFEKDDCKQWNSLLSAVFKSHAQPLYFGILKGLLYKKFTWCVYVQVYIKMNNL